jgi:hypothetical protein
VGIALAERDSGRNRPVIVVIGDGSFQYSVQSIWTAAQLHLPILIVVLRNDEYCILKSFAVLEETPGARHRTKGIFPCDAGFVIGGAAGAFLEVHLEFAALAMPVMLARWCDDRNTTIATGVISFPNQQAVTNKQ